MTKTMLESLPGIGPVTAEKIVEYREENGPFESVEEIQDVPGIGEKTFEGMEGMILWGGQYDYSRSRLPQKD